MRVCNSMYSFCRYRGIRTQLLSCLVRSLHRTTSSPTSILLCESYPKLVELLHPVDQYAIGYNLSPMTTVCSWKCPNQEDHEWKMSIQKAIKLFTSNVHQSTLFHLSCYSRYLPLLQRLCCLQIQFTRFSQSGYCQRIIQVRNARC